MYVGNLNAFVRGFVIRVLGGNDTTAKEQMDENIEM